MLKLTFLSIPVLKFHAKSFKMSLNGDVDSASLAHPWEIIIAIKNIYIFTHSKWNAEAYKEQVGK